MDTPPPKRQPSGARAKNSKGCSCGARENHSQEAARKKRRGNHKMARGRGIKGITDPRDRRRSSSWFGRDQSCTFRCSHHRIFRARSAPHTIVVKIDSCQRCRPPKDIEPDKARRVRVVVICKFGKLETQAAWHETRSTSSRTGQTA